MTFLTQFCGGDDPIECLHRLAVWLRVSVGLQAERGLNRVIAALEERESLHQLNSRDLHRDLESLEAALKRARNY